MWLNTFGERLALLVGVDINKDTKAWEAFSPKLKVEIASQADPDLWRVLYKKHGSFDIILDDGSHLTEHMIASFESLFNLLKPGGVYMIEDVTQENAESIRHILHGHIDGKPQIGLMRQFYKHPKDQKACCNFTTNWAQKNVDYIASYPMILAVRKHDGPSRDYLVAERHGTQWIPYGDADHL